MLRKNPVDRVITNLKTHFDQIHENNKQQLILSKLTDNIKQIFDLLYGSIENEPESKHIHQLIPKLIDPKHDLLYKLIKYRCYFSFDTQTYLSKVFIFVIENGGKYGIHKYIKRQTAFNGHNNIIDALFKDFDKYPGATFSVLQEMTQRSDLTSMFLHKIKIETPKLMSRNTTKHKKRHYKSQTLLNEFNINKQKHSKRRNKSDHTTNIQNESKHYKRNTAPVLKFVAAQDTTDDVWFVEGLFMLIKWPILHISWDAFKTLKYLFTTKSDKIKDEDDRVSQYLYQHSLWIFPQFNQLIDSQNVVNKRQCFNLLNELLIKANNFDVLMKYITNKDNISISRRILTNELIKAHTDDHQHNAIIDALIEDYFDCAGHILSEIASRASLSDLLLNHTYITTLDMDQNEHKYKDDDDDAKVNEDKNNKSRKDLHEFLGTKSIPNLLDLRSTSSDISYIPSPTSIKTATRYSGDDVPCFIRSSSVINEANTNQIPFVYELICLIDRSCSNVVSTYALNVLQRLLTVNKDVSAIFLSQNYDKLMVIFAKFIEKDNVRQKAFLRLICNLLLEYKNKGFRRKFKSSMMNLKMIMNLLNHKSDSIKYDAFRIFAIFVASKHKTRQIHIVLWRNTKQNKLCQFLQNLLPNTSQKYDAFHQNKKIVIHHLNNLPTPKTDESYLKLALND